MTTDNPSGTFVLSPSFGKPRASATIWAEGQVPRGVDRERAKTKRDFGVVIKRNHKITELSNRCLILNSKHCRLAGDCQWVEIPIPSLPLGSCTDCDGNRWSLARQSACKSAPSKWKFPFFRKRRHWQFIHSARCSLAMHALEPEFSTYSPPNPLFVKWENCKMRDM